MIDDISVRFILAVLVLVVGLLCIFGLYRFGTTLFGHQLPNLIRHLDEYISNVHPNNTQRLTEVLTNWHQSYLEKRNDFWEHYGQVALAVLIVVVLAVLLLTKTISAEAGLPILSAVAGFAIAKTNSTSSSTRSPETPNRDLQ